MRPASRIYAATVFLGGALMLVILGPAGRSTEWLPLGALIMLQLVMENYAFELPIAGSVSLSFALTYAALLYTGPLGAALCALSTAVTVQELRDNKPLLVVLFNAGQLVISAGLAGVVYTWMGGQVLTAELGPQTYLVPAFAAALALFLINVALVGAFVSLLKARSFTHVLHEQAFLSYGASLAVLALLGFIIAYLMSIQSWLGLMLLVLPFTAARRTFRVYVELSEAYTSTVRSLVSAIEAKDPYTRGHSERVAEYSGLIAAQMGLSRPEVETLERAALLHDVGKIGISLETLLAPRALTADETRAIRRHPSLGSDLVADVEFLGNLVDIVRHHHERLDGAGYPDGLIGDRIPLLARILAVADAYDAMTSDRAYRPGMDPTEACTELRRVAGTQLDCTVVDRFTSALQKRSAETGAA
ncbi:MAG: HD-GYP domain-containing protein [Coriobacteriia bacterium]